MLHWWTLLLLLAAGLSLLALLWHRGRIAARRTNLAEARRRFRVHRERLEAKFVQLASERLKPEAPHWTDCDFDDEVAFVRNRNTREFAALVGITIEFESANPDEAESGGALREGTAVFRFDRDHWDTDGLTLLNLTPREAIRFYHSALESVDQEVPR